MKITILGAGNVGSALGRGWMAAGHSVLFGTRNAISPKTQKMLDLIPDALILSVEDAVKDMDVLVVTTPPETVLDLIPRLGDLSGTIIIDATNSVRTKPEPYATAFHAIKALVPSAEVVKCFNTTGFENLLDPVYNGIGIDMFAAGNSLQAKQTATQLAKDLEFENCYDFGGDDKVELLEKFALSWINLAIVQGHGRNIAFKLLKR